MIEGQLTWELLGAYEACESLSDHFTEWAAMVGLDPNEAETTEAYRIVHNAYMDVWKEIGSEAFFARLNASADVWRERRASERTGKRSLVARIARRAA